MQTAQAKLDLSYFVIFGRTPTNKVIENLFLTFGDSLDPNIAMKRGGLTAHFNGRTSFDITNGRTGISPSLPGWETVSFLISSAAQ